MEPDYVAIVGNNPNNLVDPDDSTLSPMALLAESISQLFKDLTAVSNRLDDLTYRFNDWTDTTP